MTIPNDTRRVERALPSRAGTDGAVPVDGIAPLRTGWRAVRNVSLAGEDGACPPRGRLVLLHPGVGAALVEPAARATPDGAGRLSRTIGRPRLETIFAGHLPVVHVTTGTGDLGRLERRIAEAFATEPRMTLRGGRAWMGPACIALRGEVVRPPEPAAGRRLATNAAAEERSESDGRGGAAAGLRALGWFWSVVLAILSAAAAALLALGNPGADAVAVRGLGSTDAGTVAASASAGDAFGSSGRPVAAPAARP